jgi:hypothetical protein
VKLLLDWFLGLISMPKSDCPEKTSHCEETSGRRGNPDPLRYPVDEIASLRSQ